MDTMLLDGLMLIVCCDGDVNGDKVGEKAKWYQVVDSYIRRLQDAVRPKIFAKN